MTDKLSDLLKRSQNILLRISSVFPFDLFPDKLIIDETKVSIIHWDFIGTEHIHSIFIEDITDVTLDTTLFFATLRITESNNPRFPRKFAIKYLKKSEALCARRIIQGMLSAERKGIDIHTDNGKTSTSIQELGEEQTN